MYTGFQDTNLSQYNPPNLWGNLTSWTVNVVKAYTGTGTFFLTWTGNGFNSSLTPSNFSAKIDCTIAGIRTITPTAATGGVGGDVIAAYAGWFAGEIDVAKSGTSGGTLDQQPVVELTVFTDQGLTKFDVNQYGSTLTSHACSLGGISVQSHR